MKGKALLVGMVGAMVGGVLGHLAAVWLARRGFYALVLPGATLGWGAAVLAKEKSLLRAVLCGWAALLLGLLTDWRIEPFIADDGLSYYLRHLSQLRPITLLMVGVGAALGGWLGLGKTHMVVGRAAGPGLGS